MIQMEWGLGPRPQPPEALFPFRIKASSSAEVRELWYGRAHLSPPLPVAQPHFEHLAIFEI